MRFGKCACLRLAVGRKGIAPGFAALGTEAGEMMASVKPPGQDGRYDEITKVVAFLASDGASYVSGVKLFVEGGVAQI